MICSAPLCFHTTRGKGSYCSDACRTRDWRVRTHYTRPSPGNGAERRSARSGAQVSYRKAIQAAVNTAMSFGVLPDRAKAVAEVMVRDALPERQRARLRREAL